MELTKIMQTENRQELMLAPQESVAQYVAKLSKEERIALLSQYSNEELAMLQYDWNFWARPKQLIPFRGDQSWGTCILLAGRGFGKTRTGAEWVKWKAMQYPGCIIGVVAPTAGDARRIMIQGDSGIERICPPGFAKYKPAQAKVDFANGSTALIFTADEPSRIRGNNLWFAWCDEPQSWRYEDALDMLDFTLRLGDNPQILCTMTPLPNEITYRLTDEEKMASGETILVTGSMYENQANLSTKFIKNITDKYQDSPLGDQEIYAMVLRDIPGALFKREWIQTLPKYDPRDERKDRKKDPDFERTVLAVDVAVTSKDTSDFTVLTLGSKGTDGNYYIQKIKGMKKSPKEWAEEIVKWYYMYKVDQIVVEINNGGEMIEEQIRMVKRVTINGFSQKFSGADLPIRTIHAKKGKRTRAESVSQLYQRKKVFHMENFPELIKQMVIFTGEKKNKDDYVDSMVYCIRELAGSPEVDLFVPMVGGMRSSSNLDLI